ncbi:hypothetical protein FACS1894182_13480 [Bacteroidia bacterium]|nr:hypothetical protein FACS1894182_13480 [Bacteroidia bacterium]
MNQKKHEEMAKTTLPGCKGGQEIPVPKVVSEQPVQVKAGKIRKGTHQSLRQPFDAHSEFVHLDEKETAEEIVEPVLDIEDMDDIKKAVVYTEIFNRKEY